MNNILPPVTRNIIILNVIVFVLSMVPAIGQFTYHYFPLYFWKSQYFEIYQFLTSIFMHGNFMHIFFNMFGVYMFGRTIEGVMGEKRYLQFYLLAGIGAGLLQLIVYYLTTRQALEQGIAVNYDNYAVIGASGSVFGLLAAFGYLFPNTTVYVQFLLPIKAKYFVLIYAAIELFSGISQRPGDNVAHFAHLGGALIGIILLRIWGYKPYN